MDLLAIDAYSLGSGFGAIFRWVLLGAVAIVAVQRLQSGRYSPARAGVTLAVVGALAVASLVVGGSGTARAGAAERSMKAGCTASGAPEAYCDCAWDELVAAGIDTEAEMDAINEQATGGAIPPQIAAVARTCASTATAG